MKHLSLIIFFAMFGFVTAQYTNIQCPENCIEGRVARLEREVDLVKWGLVGFWEFDGDSESPYDDTYNGVIGGPVAFVPGQIGQAASFPGGSGTGSYAANVGRVDSQKIMPASSAEFKSGFSIMAWVNPSASGHNVILSHDQSCGGSNPYYAYYGFIFDVSSAGELQLFMRDAYDYLMGSSAPGLVNINVWTHVAVTWDGKTTGGIKLYVNGISVNTIITKSGNFSGLTTTGELPIRIGAGFANSLNTMAGFYGKLDHVSIWKRALSDSFVFADSQN